MRCGGRSSTSIRERGLSDHGVRRRAPTGKDYAASRMHVPLILSPTDASRDRDRTPPAGSSRTAASWQSSAPGDLAERHTVPRGGCRASRVWLHQRLPRPASCSPASRLRASACGILTFATLSDMSDDSPVQFEIHRVEDPGTATCPGCQQTVSLPHEQPWIVVGGVALPPSSVMSFPCPNCRTRIYLTEVDESRRRFDAETDAQPVLEKPIKSNDREEP